MLLQIIWDINPEVFRIGEFSLRYYSLFFAISFTLGFYLINKIYKNEGLQHDLVNQLLIYIIVGTVVGARLGHTLFYEFAYFKHHLLEILLPFKITNGKFELTGYQGLASHGGAIGILVAVWFYSRKNKLKMLWVLDRIVIAIAFGGFFIRLGNFFNSEILGAPSNLPWAVIFAKIDTIPRHPAQLYEALAYLLVFFMLYLKYRKNHSFRSGLLFGFFLILTFTARFLIEFLKEDQEPFEQSLILNMGQLLSIPFVALGLYYVFRRSAKNAGLEKIDSKDMEV